MNETIEQLMIWGSIGMGVGLMTSGHRRLGMMVASVAPVTVATLHPRGTHRALRAIPVALAVSGRAIGESGKVSGEAFWKSTRKVGRGLVLAGRTIQRAAS